MVVLAGDGVPHNDLMQFGLGFEAVAVEAPMRDAVGRVQDAPEGAPAIDTSNVHSIIDITTGRV